MSMPKLRIGNLELNIPIIQGGMSVGISLSNLAAAVANQGGVGVIGAAGIGFSDKDFDIAPYKANVKALKREIAKARKLTNGIIGVNIMKALSDFDNLFITAIQEKIDIIFVGAGMLLAMPKGIAFEQIKNIKTKIIPIVSSSRAVKLIFDFWAKNYNRLPDGIVVEGPKAGGHLGFRNEDIDKKEFKLENILKDIIDTVNQYKERFNIHIPVIAAGGIYSAKDIKKFINMGADGVQIATRFVATEECDASEEFKNTYLKAEKKDIKIIKSPVGMPGRAIINTFLTNIAKGLRQPINCKWKCLRSCRIQHSDYCIAKALLNAKQGFLNNGFAFAGANVFKIKSIVKVKDIINELKNNY